MTAIPTLHFMCGKMAAGKSTLAAQIAKTQHAVLLVEDDWLSTLYPEEVRSLADYIQYSERLKKTLQPHVEDLLGKGISVVLDFPANTVSQRQWFAALISATGVEHCLHYVDKPDEVCKAQLKIRSQNLPAGSPFTTDEAFDAITRFFEPPQSSEGFMIQQYQQE
ncbi:ATP-binding protein [Photobacterium sp. TLY01]|uniref:AAA family ATPase n=1 Tax=Photobacterium sp. TLY01 TaxID=2907534 RepID=UPI001F23164D|nr:ATP-binding protein [Photobacterium sp. TLY01]UIP26701.1 ATP-binding protein [Photobacterium sp. TLY01]